jgi:hypothetical protein
MTMEASTMSPTATAMPPRDMTLEVTLSHIMGRNPRTVATGSVRMGRSALGKCHRKRMMTSETISISAPRASVMVRMASRMSPERS